MARYKTLDISFPNRIVAEMEANGAAERESVRRNLTFTFIERMSARVMAFLFATGCVVAAVYLAVIGEPWVAGVLASTTIGAVTAAMLKGKVP